MMERPSRTLKVKNNKQTNNNIVLTKEKQRGQHALCIKLKWGRTEAVFQLLFFNLASVSRRMNIYDPQFGKP